MAIIEVQEIWNGRMATRDIGNVRDYRRTFRIITNNMNDGPLEVGGDPFVGIPGLWTPYIDTEGRFDLGALLVKFTPRQTADPFVWELDCEYSSAIDRFLSPYGRSGSGRSGKAENAQNGAQQNPLLQPPIIKFSQARYQREVEYAVATIPGFTTQGQAIQNSAADPFSPPAIADYSRLVVTYDRNEARAPYSALNNYLDAINSDIFWGFQPYCCKMNVTAESAFQNGIFYWRVTYTIEFRLDLGISIALSPVGWCRQFLDKGLREIKTVAGISKYAQCTDWVGHPTSAPVPLDGNGHQLAQGGTPVWSSPYALYPIMAFAPLGLIAPN